MTLPHPSRPAAAPAARTVLIIDRNAMRGTVHAPVRCVALTGTVGEEVCCGIYEKRASPCRELEPWDENGQPSEQCTKARAAHNLPPLDPMEGKPPQPPETPWPLTA